MNTALPQGVRGMAERGADWAEWVDALPGLRDELLAEWELVEDGLAMHGFTALVVPVRQGRRRAVLKIGFPHEESELEHVALQQWAGRGAVRLLRADPRRGALLLERVGPESLLEAWDVSACEEIGALYPRLHQRALPQLRPLSEYVDRETRELAELPSGSHLPRRLVEQAVSTSRDLVARPEVDSRLIHGDLHYANVLSRDGGWVAIDPKPMNGDPHYEVAPLLWNRFDELAQPGGSGVRRGVRQRFFAVVDAAELDEDLAAAWVLVRMLHLAADRLHDSASSSRSAADREHLTMCLTVAKAVQP